MNNELGVRDGRIWGRPNVNLTPDVLAELGAVLGTVIGEGSLVVTARDYYPPSRMLKRAFSSGLMSTGITVIDFHGATTPELAFAIKRFGAKCGIQFTVSPYGEDTINVKFIDSNTAVFSRDKINNILELHRRRRIVRSLPYRIGWVSYAEYIHDIYVASVSGYLDTSVIRNFHPQVVVDHNFGPSDIIIPELYSNMGVDLISINAHRPPPRRGVRHLPPLKSLKRLSDITLASDSLMGVALCSDATRTLFIDEQGKIIDPDTITAIFLRGLPDGSTIVVSPFVSERVDIYASKRRIRVYRTRSITSDIPRYIRRLRAVFGYSGRCEYIFPQFSYTPDANLAIGKMLEILGYLDVKLSHLVSEIPKLPVYEEKIKIEEKYLQRVIDNLFEADEKSVSTINGIKKIVNNQVVYVKVLDNLDGLKVGVEKPTNASIDAVKRVTEEIERVLENIVR